MQSATAGGVPSLIHAIEEHINKKPLHSSILRTDDNITLKQAWAGMGRKAALRVCVALLYQKAWLRKAEIERECEVSKGFVEKWCNVSLEEYSDFLDVHRSGRPSNVSDELRSWIASALHQPGMSTRRIIKIIENERGPGIVSSPNAIAAIAHAAGLSWRLPREVPLLTGLHREKRMAFCRHWIGVDFEAVKEIMFSDEKLFQVTGPWRGAWKLPEESHLHPVLRQSHVRVMVWGAVGWTGKTRLYMGTASVTASLYISEMLEKTWLPYAASRASAGLQLRLVEDGAPAHRARDTRSWHESHGTALVHGPEGSPCAGQWPPNSPDINGPIENIWGDMAVAVGSKMISTKTELIEAIDGAWKEIVTKDRVQAAIQGWQKRLERIIDLDGFIYYPPLSSPSMP